MEDLNKISSTRIGDNIHFLVNGKDDRGTVVKMDHSYITVLKDNGKFQHIHINDTFFIKNIIVDKTWDDMDHEERYEALVKVHAPTPRYLYKAWKQLPKELQEVLLKSTPQGKTTGSNYGVEVPKPDTVEDAKTDDDYDGDERTEAMGKQFKHERLKPKEKNNPIEASHKEDEKKEEWDGKFSPERGHDKKEGAHGKNTLTEKKEFSSKDGQNEDKDDKKKAWEEWLNKEGVSTMADGGNPATTKGRDSGYETFNPIYGKKQRHGGQGKDAEGTRMQEKC